MAAIHDIQKTLKSIGDEIGEAIVQDFVSYDVGLVIENATINKVEFGNKFTIDITLKIMATKTYSEKSILHLSYDALAQNMKVIHHEYHDRSNGSIRFILTPKDTFDYMQEEEELEA